MQVSNSSMLSRDANLENVSGEISYSPDFMNSAQINLGYTLLVLLQIVREKSNCTVGTSKVLEFRGTSLPTCKL